jgi:hypothetical protein
LEQKFPARTYLGVTAGLLRSDADRTVGAVQFDASGFQPSSTRQSLDYDERTLAVTLNQLVGDELAFGATYQVSQARLRSSYPDISSAVAVSSPLALSQQQEATLHQVHLYGGFNHPSGFFCGVEGLWNAQANKGYAPALAGDDFWQLNAYAGYRWWRRHAEVRVALLNLTDQDYRLNPLNLTTQLPRDRTLAVSFRFSF